MSESRPYCLSIAGHDPGGGAGILADIKTFEQLKVYGLGVISAVTSQNDDQFNGLEWIDFEGIKNQLNPLIKYDIKGIKIGLIQSFTVLEKLLQTLRDQFPNAFIVWDPVLSATAGYQFHSAKKIGNNIIKMVDLITPNQHEYEQLNLDPAIQTALLLKGGHGNNKGTDILYTPGNQEIKITGSPFENRKEKHGTGCVLSSAITSYLAKNTELAEACKSGKLYVEKLMQSNNQKLGYHS